MILCMETYENQECHDSMYGITWNLAIYMVPNMELHGNFMDSDTGIKEKWTLRQLKIANSMSQSSDF